MEKYVLEHLQCVICNQYFSNMMQCYNGHAHCYDCFRKCELSTIRKTELQCSVCRTRKGWSTNRQMYQVAVKSGICVECGIEDCQEKVDVEYLTAHRNRCPCTRFQCPVQYCDCNFLLSGDILSHVLSHQKITKLCHNSHYIFVFSEMIQLHPKVFVFEDKVIQIQCQTIYDRKMESRILIKASILGYKENTNTHLTIHQWNMLNTNYSKHVVNIESNPESDFSELPETLLLTGMKNFIHEPPNATYFYEQKVDGPSKKPKIPIKTFEFDANEDCQEVHILTFSCS